MMTSWLLALLLVQEPSQSPPSRPAELLQAKSCATARAEAAPVLAALPNDQLIPLDGVPSCLSQILKRLEAQASELTKGLDANAVVRIGVGRGFSSTTLLFSAPNDSQIHYVDDTGSLTDILTSEWSDYHSPDGDLGWSGFVLVIDQTGTKVRFSTSADSPLEAYDAMLELEREFFPNKQAPIETDSPPAND